MNRRKVIYFEYENGFSPCRAWLNNLDPTNRAIVVRHIIRLSFGGMKKAIKALKDGIFEIKINFGPGYRVYFGEDRCRVIVLLLGGTKKTQNSDIKKAKENWRHYGKSK